MPNEISTGTNSTTITVSSAIIPSDTELSNITITPYINSHSVGAMSASDYETFDSSVLSSTKPSVGHWPNNAGASSYVDSISLVATEISDAGGGQTSIKVAIANDLVAAPYYSNNHQILFGTPSLSAGGSGDPHMKPIFGKGYTI